MPYLTEAQEKELIHSSVDKDARIAELTAQRDELLRLLDMAANRSGRPWVDEARAAIKRIRALAAVGEKK